MRRHRRRRARSCPAPAAARPPARRPARRRARTPHGARSCAAPTRCGRRARCGSRRRPPPSSSRRCPAGSPRRRTRRPGDRHRHRRRAVGEVVAPVGEHGTGQMAGLVALGVRPVARLAVDHLAAHVQEAHRVEVLREPLNGNERADHGANGTKLVQAPMDIVFETHSISTDNEAGIATGWLGGELSAAGREQARLLGGRRRCDAIDTVLVSDLARAVETAQIAFVGSGLAVRRDRAAARVRLRRVERHAGRAAGGRARRAHRRAVPRRAELPRRVPRRWSRCSRSCARAATAGGCC